jgi:hypothetical protein
MVHNCRVQQTVDAPSIRAECSIPAVRVACS